MNRKRPKEYYYHLQNDLGETVTMKMSFRNGQANIDSQKLTKGTYFLCKEQEGQLLRERFVVWRES